MIVNLIWFTLHVYQLLKPLSLHCVVAMMSGSMCVIVMNDNFLMDCIWIAMPDIAIIHYLFRK